MYRVGLPFWRTFARLFGRASFRVTVTYDQEAQVFVATSPDLKGFVVEAESLDELVREANDVVAMLMDIHLRDNNKTKLEPIYNNLGSAALHP